jgi:hypothetical protein
MNRRGVLTSILVSVSGVAWSRGKRAMTNYAVHFPAHVVKFALPDEMVRQMPRDQIPDYFEPGDFSFKRGYEGLVTAAVDFEGPWWVGTVGSLTFDIHVMKRDKTSLHSIDAIDSLGRYIQSTLSAVQRATSRMERTTVNGTDCLLRTTGEWFQVYSFPLDDEIYIEFALQIEKLSERSNSKWVRRAETMRDAIKASLDVKSKRANPA